MYRFLRAFGGSVEDYLDTPVDTVNWLLGLADMEAERESAAIERMKGGRGS